MALSLTVDWSLDWGTERELRRRIVKLEAELRARHDAGDADEYEVGYLDGYRNALALVAHGLPFDGAPTKASPDTRPPCWDDGSCPTAV
jgi:hypothetical protein